MNADEYHALRNLSNSVLRIGLTKSWEHARLAQLTQLDEPTAEMERGTALHALILEGEDQLWPVDAPDWRTAKAKAERMEARNQGMIPVLAHKSAEIYEIASNTKVAVERYLGYELAKDGQAEHTILFRQEDVDCKARLDWLSNDRRTILDLKFTELSSPAAFMRSIVGSGYHWQAEFYKRAVRAAYEVDAQFIFCVTECFEPYPVYFVTLDSVYAEIANQGIDRALKEWRACMDLPKGESWPCYEDTYMAEPPAWAFKEAEAEGLEMQNWSIESFLFGRVENGK